MYLVDTSVWIETFRARKPLRIAEVVDPEEIATCLPVVQEVLQGFRDERAYRLAREALFAMPLVESPMSAAVYEEAVALYRGARRQGISVRSSVDCLIAACAIRNHLVVLHRDRDYALLSRVSALMERPV